MFLISGRQNFLMDLLQFLNLQSTIFLLFVNNYHKNITKKSNFEDFIFPLQNLYNPGAPGELAPPLPQRPLDSLPTTSAPSNFKTGSTPARGTNINTREKMGKL